MFEAMLSTRTLSLLVLFLVASGAVAPAGASAGGLDAVTTATPAGLADTAAAPTTTGSVDDGILARYEVARVADGEVGVRLTLTAPENVASLTLGLPDGATVAATDGFRRADDGRYEWSGGSPATVEYVVDPGGAATGATGTPPSAAGTDWMLVNLYDVDARVHWSYWHEPPAFEERIALAPGQVGERGPTMALLGPATTYTERSARQEYRITVSDAADPKHSTAELFDGLHAADAGLAVGGRVDRVNLFYVPDLPGYAGYANGRAVGGAYDVAIDASAWKLTTVHEYVHTRQVYAPSDRMAWTDEGIADYYESLLALHNGDLAYSQFHRRVTTDEGARATLTDRDTWPSRLTEYTKGRRVVAALDARIRTETDGARSFQDVFSRMNAHEGELTYGDFSAIVVAVGGESFGPWLDRYVDGSDVPPVPDDPSLFTSTVRDDSDGDGLSDAAERTLGTDSLAADTDGDGLSDGTEVDVGSDPLASDTDGDGLDDRGEYDRGTDPTAADTDGDGLLDGEEVEAGLDPTAGDSDGDGLSDGREADVGSDPLAPDTDGDGLSDGFEVDLGTDPLASDTDGDGLDDGEESTEPTSPTRADTDGDGLDDGEESERGTDPVVADSDGDGLADGEEVDVGSDPRAVDTDGDGLDDGEESAAGTDPLALDTDGDGLSDLTETDGPTDPLVADTDGDGLDDEREANVGTDPLAPDTDGDGLADGVEVGLGTDPTATDTDGDGYDDAEEDDVGTDPTAETGGIERFLAGVAAALRGLF